MDKDEIKKLIEKHEGRESKVYKDTEGHPTIGVGFNLDRADARQKIEALGLDYDKVRSGEVSLDKGQIDSLRDADVDHAIEAARDNVSNFDGLSDNRQAALTDMAFNLGSEGLSKFKNTIDAVESGDFEKAAEEMADSQWAGQVGNRSAEDIELMKDDLDES